MAKRRKANTGGSVLSALVVSLIGAILIAEYIGQVSSWWVLFTGFWVLVVIGRWSQAQRRSSQARQATALAQQQRVLLQPSGSGREPISSRLRMQVLDRDGFRCVYCGRSPQPDGVRLHLDHRVPVSRGGLTTLENLVTACDQCNLGKSNLPLGAQPNPCTFVILRRGSPASIVSHCPRSGSLRSVGDLEGEYVLCDEHVALLEAEFGGLRVGDFGGQRWIGLFEPGDSKGGSPMVPPQRAPMRHAEIEAAIQSGLRLDLLQPDERERVDLRGPLLAGHQRLIQGPGIEAVGESWYRDAIERHVGRRAEGHKTIVDAVLIAEPDNVYDSNAIAIQLGGETVAHLAREDAARYEPVMEACRAKGFIPCVRADVRGGFRKADGSWADFGITLYVASPDKLLDRWAALH